MNDKALTYFKSQYPGHQWELMTGRSAGSIRSVYRLTKNDQPEFYVKIYNPRKLLDKLSNSLHPRTLQEARIYEALRQATIKTPLVHSHLRFRSATALITQALSPGNNLYTCERPRQAAIMLNTAVKLLQKNFTHTDLHAGNVLLDNNGEPVLIDVYEIKAHARITTRHIVQLLAGVDSIYDYPPAELTAALSRISATTQSTELVKKIKRTAAKMRAKRVKRWVKRTLREGSFSRRIKTSDYTAYVNRRFTLDIQDILTEPKPTEIQITGPQGPLTCSVQHFPALPRFAAIPALQYWRDLATKHFYNIPAPHPIAVIILKNRGSIIVTAPQ